MLRWFLRRQIARFDRRRTHDAGYPREMIDIDCGAVLAFGRAPAISNYRKDGPAAVWAAAGLIAVMSEDCGPYAPLGIDMAERDGVDPVVLRAVVARLLGRGEAACRQLAARARAHIEAGRPRFPASREQSDRLAAAFQAAVASGDTAALLRILAQDAVLYSDGGGKRAAALNPIHGSDRIMRFFAGILRKNPVLAAVAARPATVNGLPGFVLREDDGALYTMAIEQRDGLIVAIYLTRNPEKLRHVRF